MDNTELHLEPFAIEQQSIIRQWYFNPVVSFLAFPSVHAEKRDEFLMSFLSEETCLTINIGDQLIGCILLRFDQNLRIFSIFIEPKFRQHKYSKEALQELIIRFPNTQFEAFLHENQREHHSLFKAVLFNNTEEKKIFQFEEHDETFIRFELHS